MIVIRKEEEDEKKKKKKIPSFHPSSKWLLHPPARW